jgi:hypothetical protein
VIALQKAGRSDRKQSGGTAGARTASHTSTSIAGG